MPLTRDQYIAKWGPLVKQLTPGTGIFPEVMMARAIIESQANINGNWYPGASELALNANNHFGIKADSSWKGAKYKARTGEYSKDGNKYYIYDYFRKYDTTEQSFQDFIKFLKSNSRYANAGLFTAPTVQEQNNRLYAAGYFTDPSGAALSTSVASSIANKLKSIASNVYNYAANNKKKTLGIVLLIGFITLAITTTTSKNAE